MNDCEVLEDWYLVCCCCGNWYVYSMREWSIGEMILTENQTLRKTCCVACLFTTDVLWTRLALKCSMTVLCLALAIIQKSIAVRFPRLRLHGVIRIALWWWWGRRMGETVRTGENQSTGRWTCSVDTLSTIKMHGDWPVIRPRAFAVRCCHQITLELTRALPCLYTYHTSCLGQGLMDVTVPYGWGENQVTIQRGYM